MRTVCYVVGNTNSEGMGCSGSGRMGLLGAVRCWDYSGYWTHGHRKSLGYSGSIGNIEVMGYGPFFWVQLICVSTSTSF